MSTSAVDALALRFREQGDLAGLEALGDVAKALRKIKAENTGAVAAAAKGQPLRPLLTDLYARIVAVVQPVTQILTNIIIAATGSGIMQFVNRDETAFEGVRWLTANGLLYGVAGLGMIMFHWRRLPQDMRAVLAFLAAAVMFGIGMVLYLDS